MADQETSDEKALATLVENLNVTVQKLGQGAPSKALVKMEMVDLVPFDKDEEFPEGQRLEKSILRVLNGPKGSVERFAFEVDPTYRNHVEGIYYPKRQGLPDTVLKRICIQDDLVAAIINARSNQIGVFGHPRQKRSELGFVLEPRVGVIEALKPEQKAELDKRCEAAVRKLVTCGDETGLARSERMSLSTWFKMSTKNAIGLGRLATELVWSLDVGTGKKKFSRFRPIDAGTIFMAVPQKEIGADYRKQAVDMLARLKNKQLKLDIPESEIEKDYAWVQVINGKVEEVFTEDECVVHNFYPVADIEMTGYPVTPLDTVISAVTTHLNITTHNKLYFETGRASRGMLVFKSDDIDDRTLAGIKQQFNASINGAGKSWRMPVFKVGPEDDVTWSPIDNSSRDAEFQYLTDANARIIFSAFQMAPEELPGWSYLSRGTNSQALSEANTEFQITAARDLGIRPLVKQFEDFLNGIILPLIDEELSKLVEVRLLGLDAETPEKEAVRLQQDMPLHMTMDQVLEKVEKKPLGKSMGGDFPLNPQWQQIAFKFLSVGEIKEFFFGVPGASQDPNLQYYPDPFWFQWQQLQDERQQAQMAMQQQAQQAAQGGAGGEGGDDGGGSPGGEAPSGAGVSDTGQPQGGQSPGKTENQKDHQVQQGPPAGEDLTRSANQAIAALLGKSEADLPASKRRLLAQQKLAVKQGMDDWEADIAKTVKELAEIASKHLPAKKRN